MKFTYTMITAQGTVIKEYTVDESNKVTEKVKFDHNKIEFDKWFAKLEEKYNEEQENKYY